MIEQEKRDYLILEMAQKLCEAAGISCQNCPKSHSPEEYGECELPEICNTLADYVLCKEEEVIKKTEAKLKRLLLVLCNRQHNYYPSIDSYCVSEKVVKLDDIKDQFKKAFGMEVEE